MIEPVLFTRVTLPDQHPRAGEQCPVFGFVIRHREGPVLVDTGVGTGHELIEKVYEPEHVPIDEALAERGIDPADVIMVINSHLHFDHCGNNRRFPGVPLVVQDLEYEAARQPGYTVPEWVDFPAARWEPVSGETEVLAGIRVLPTPGHTPGHQSVVVETGSDVLVIAAQGVYDPDELETGQSVEPLTPVEAEAIERSARSIKSLRPAAVYFSHHPGVWPQR